MAIVAMVVLTADSFQTSVFQLRVVPGIVCAILAGMTCVAMGLRFSVRRDPGQPISVKAKRAQHFVNVPSAKA